MFPLRNFGSQKYESVKKYLIRNKNVGIQELYS